MKEKMYSRTSNSMLHDHIIDGTLGSFKGMKISKDKWTREEYTHMLELILDRLEKRIHDFRLKEGLLQAGKRLTAVIFAFTFAYMQINGDDLDMRRTSRTRTTRSVRGRNGRRRSEDVGSPF